MRSLASRRLQHGALTIAVLAGIAAWTVWQRLALNNPAFDTGYLLLAALLFLAAYNLRKKLAFLPGPSSAAWLQAHLYTGLATAVLFALHVGWKIPDGILESVLAALFVATFLSGLLGIWWTRTIPKKLARVREEVIFERIPILRRHLRERAQQLVLDTVHAAGATTLGEFYAARLADYFDKPPRWSYFLRPNNRTRRKLLAELTEVGRYLSEPEQQAAEQLFALVRSRDDLDYHAAMQWRLKAWLFVHIGLTYPLLLVAVLHGWLAHLFDGGVL